jgi:hypothetical protein
MSIIYSQTASSQLAVQDSFIRSKDLSDLKLKNFYQSSIEQCKHDDKDRRQKEQADGC